MIRSVEESFNMSDDSGGPNLGVTRKKKIAIGVIFLLSPNEAENSRFQEFFFSHFPLFESHMNKLKTSIEQVSKMPTLPCNTDICVYIHICVYVFEPCKCFRIMSFTSQLPIPSSVFIMLLFCFTRL